MPFQLDGSICALNGSAKRRGPATSLDLDMTVFTQSVLSSRSAPRARHAGLSCDSRARGASGPPSSSSSSDACVRLATLGAAGGATSWTVAARLPAGRSTVGHSGETGRAVRTSGCCAESPAALPRRAEAGTGDAQYADWPTTRGRRSSLSSSGRPATSCSSMKRGTSSTVSPSYQIPSG